MNMLIGAFGSYGDVLPLIALAEEFAARNNKVIFYANPIFLSKISNTKIRFIPVGSREEYFELFDASYESNPIHSFKRIARELMNLSPVYYDLMKKDTLFSDTIVIHNSLLFAARLLSETENIPCVTVHLAPSVFRSNIDPARLVPKWIDKTSLQVIKSFSWWMLDTFFYEPNFTNPLNDFRKKLGLPEVKRIFKSWIHEADLVIGLFPKWFAPPQKDWPANLVLCGFPLFDQAQVYQEPTTLTRFLDDELPIVVFSAGTASAKANEFFNTSVEVCQQLGIKGILLSPFQEHIPFDLPENVIYMSYVPFSLLLPQVNLFVHHGGIGSISQALQSGVAQIIRPIAYDQFDNSDKTVKLGVAREILPANYTIKNLKNVITELLQDHMIHQTCREMSSKLLDNDAIKITCDTIEQRFIN